MPKFLETITFMGNDVLIPIDRIKYIYSTYENKVFKIKINSDECDHEENFNLENDMLTRWREISKIIGAK